MIIYDGYFNDRTDNMFIYLDAADSVSSCSQCQDVNYVLKCVKGAFSENHPPVKSMLRVYHHGNC